jgi:hypothetical protein
VAVGSRSGSRSRELHGERETVELVDQPWLEVQHAVADAAALQQVQGPGHDAHVDAFLGGAALHVAEVAFQRLPKPLP